ncbi:MAG: hypothetical protein PHQ23_01215 [Candidatus Wallbacteria bacterium]|nr:hypothetical protein [Candidatus Wallbacteria bacterium]
MKSFAVLLLSCMIVFPAKTSDFSMNSGQVILVIADNWEKSCAFMHLLDRDSAGWKTWRTDIPVNIGRNGLGWGLGLHPAGLSGPVKREGDGKAPAGVFTLGHAMGYSAFLPFDSRIGYVQLTKNLHGVDDSDSDYYNRIVDITTIDGGWRKYWTSHETMRRDDNLYKWLVVVNHNRQCIPMGGSMIFMHIWRGHGLGTAGCTAMTEFDILDLIRWLDPEKKPVLVQLPLEAYKEYCEKWDLPEVSL